MGFLDRFKSEKVKKAEELSKEERQEAREYVNLIGDAKKAHLKWQKLGTAMIEHLDSKFSPHFNSEEQVENSKQEFQENFGESIEKLDEADEIWKDMNQRQRNYCKSVCGSLTVTAVKLDTYHPPSNDGLSSILKAVITRDLSHILGQRYFTERPAKVKQELEKEHRELERAIEAEINE